MLVCYSADKAIELDQPIRERLERLYGAEAAGALLPECLPGDFYLDSIAVDERYRGRGIAKGLMSAFEERGREEGFLRLSLIVEQYNEGAYALYRCLGFVDDGILSLKRQLIHPHDETDVTFSRTDDFLGGRNGEELA